MPCAAVARVSSGLQVRTSRVMISSIFTVRSFSSGHAAPSRRRFGGVRRKGSRCAASVLADQVERAAALDIDACAPLPLAPGGQARLHGEALPDWRAGLASERHAAIPLSAGCFFGERLHVR